MSKSEAFPLNAGIPEGRRTEGLIFKPSVMPPEYFDPEALMKLDASISREDAEKMVERSRQERVFRSRDFDKHNKAVNERLDRGYTIWGHPVNHDGRIAQTLIRKDFLEERARGGSGKNNRGSSYGRNGGNGGLD